MSKTIHRDNYVIRNNPTKISDDDWDLAFKRDKVNAEKNRYKRKQRENK